VPVFVYTNYPKAELFVNGKSQGVKTKTEESLQSKYRLMWHNVKYEPGEIRVVAYNDQGEVQEEKVTRTAGRPVSIVMSPDRKVIKADGKDLCFITLEVVDKDGVPVPDATNFIFIDVQGKGRLKALCNGDATSQIPFSSTYMPLFSGKMVAVIESAEEGGEIDVTAISVGLKTQKCTVKSEK
ncbi:MAG: DUF4982 domain-containing protein, partial [Bacteroidales bacterium]